MTNEERRRVEEMIMSLSEEERLAALHAFSDVAILTELSARVSCMRNFWNTNASNVQKTRTELGGCFD